MSKNTIFSCRNIDFYYGEGSTKEVVLRDISIDIKSAEFTCLAGPSGSGKSTLLNLFGQLDKPKSGNLSYLGNPVSSFDAKRLNKMRRYELGFIFQDFQLLEVLSVYENVEYFLCRMGISKIERAALVQDALEQVGMWSHRKKWPKELSGGQKQRVAIARALAKRPKVIIADEPTASLDLESSVQVMEILSRLNRERDVTIIMASHDPMVLDYVSRIVKLENGQIRDQNKEVVAC